MAWRIGFVSIIHYLEVKSNQILQKSAVLPAMLVLTSHHHYFSVKLSSIFKETNGVFETSTTNNLKSLVCCE